VSMDEALDAMRKLCPGMGAWVDWNLMDPTEAQVGILEHQGQGPATRVCLGRGRSQRGGLGPWDVAMEKAREKVASWGQPKEPRKPKEPDPDELPQEELLLDAAPPAPKAGTSTSPTEKPQKPS